MTKRMTDTKRYDRKRGHAGKAAEQIRLQDFYNSVACIADGNLRSDIAKNIDCVIDRIYQNVDSHGAVKLWVDGSYNAGQRNAGIGIVIDAHGHTDDASDGMLYFGKSLNRADSSIKAEVYALSIGLSYLLDRFQDLKDVHVYYDCMDSVICAANINSFAAFGAPYTNFKSVLKRIRKRGINVAFEHVKAHANNRNNEICDVISKHYSRSNMTAAQTRLWKQVKSKLDRL